MAGCLKFESSSVVPAKACFHRDDVETLGRVGSRAERHSASGTRKHKKRPARRARLDEVLISEPRRGCPENSFSQAPKPTLAPAPERSGASAVRLPAPCRS